VRRGRNPEFRRAGANPAGGVTRPSPSLRPATPPATIHIKSAEQDGDFLQLNFDADLCQQKQPDVRLPRFRWSEPVARSQFGTADGRSR
jgi:hypothetical protein